MLEPDRGEIETFVDTLFRHADLNGFVSSRSFEHDNKPFNHHGVPLSGGLKFLIDVAVDDAHRAANYLRGLAR